MKTSERIYQLVFVLGALTIGDCQEASVDEALASVFGPGGNPQEGLKWIPSGFEVISTTPLPSLAALERCGDGTQKGRKVCVPYHRCDPDTDTVVAEPVEQNTDGAGLIDIRAGVNECENYLEVCCNLPADGQIPTVPPVVVEPTTPSVRPTPKPSFCGIRNTRGIDFTITGNTNEVEYGEFPWVLMILNSTGQVCGASLITPQVALTGAHCVARYKNNLRELRIRAGEWDTLTEKERLPYQERAVTRLIVHEGFNPKSLVNDFALLILDRPYSQADNIGTVCLPPPGQIFTASDCFTGGWGVRTFSGKQPYSNILKKIELPMVNKNRCQGLLQTTRLGAHFKLDESFVCAGAEGRDACTGDGGSPLVCPDPNNPGRYQQAGIVAWGIGCGTSVPGVYADVSKARSWIDTRLKQLGFDTVTYTE